MTKFIKLTSTIININNIKKIRLNPNKISIFFINHKIDKIVNDKIDVCKDKCPKDYKIVSEWMNENYQIYEKK